MTKEMDDDKTETEDKNYNGAYRLDCEHCCVNYIGETGKMPGIRKHEISQKLKMAYPQINLCLFNKDSIIKYKILTK